MRKRIAFVKTAWSENYQGDPVVGRHAHISEFDEGHERFNFLRANDDRFYGYLPPIGSKHRPPQPKEKKDWLVVFVAARNGTGPLTVVGWYNNANFESDYTDRPEYQSGNDFETDSDGENYIYCVSSDSANLIPVSERYITVPGDHIKRTPIVYARGNGQGDDWRRALSELAEKIVKPGREKLPRSNPSLRFPDQEHRDKVEKASIAEAIRYLESKKYKLTDRQKDRCGYDLLAKRKRQPKELHVEVKGTSNEAMRFFMSRNEKQYMPNTKWRLLLITDALNIPRVSIFTERQVTDAFEFNPFAWEATQK